MFSLIDPFCQQYIFYQLYLAKWFYNRSVLSIFGSLVGSPEEAEELLLAALALRFRRRGSVALAGPGPRPGGTGRPYLWAAAIRFSLKYFLIDPYFGVFQPQIIVFEPNMPKITTKK
jgi:hypothetical protein